MNRIHNILILCLCLVGISSAIGGEPRVAKYREYMKAGDYTKALLELNDGLRGRIERPPEEKASFLLEKAQYYRDYVNDYPLALQMYADVADLPLSEDNPLKQKALGQSTDLRRKLKEFESLKRELDEFQMLKPEKKARLADVWKSKLETLPDNCPHLPALYHVLGDAYLQGEHYHQAYIAFHNALQRAPLLYYAYPTLQLQQTAKTKWATRKATTIVVWTLATVAVLVAAGLLLSKPWTWMRWTHFLPLPILCVVWLVVHPLIVKLSIAMADKTPPLENNTVVHAEAGYALSELLSKLWYYGFAIMVLVYFICLLSTRIRLCATRYFVNATACFIALVPLVGHYALLNCLTTFEAKDGNTLPYLKGTFKFRSDDPLPFALMDPKAYPGYAIEDVDEPIVREFFESVGYLDDEYTNE